MSINPVNAELKISRHSLSQRVDKALQNLATGEDKSILNFWGCPGGGRTTLLEGFKSQLLENENVSVLGIWDADSAPIDKIIADIQNSLDNNDLNKVKVILIDNLRALEEDGTDNPVFLQFEHNLMATIVHRRDVLTLIVSQHEIRQWHELVVRMRQVSYPIPPLSREEFEHEAQRIGLDPLDAFARCQGHLLPLEWIRENKNISTQEIDRQATDYFLKDLKKDVREETRVLSLLVQFDEALMEKVLKNAGLARRKNYFALLESIRHMGFAGLIIHDSRSGMYHFTDPSVKQLLARGYRFEKPEQTMSTHSLLATYYIQASSRSVTLQNFFVSSLYHLAWNAALSGGDAVKRCKQWLADMMTDWQDVNWKAVQDSWLNKDDSFIYAELTTMLGNDTCEYITIFIKQQLEEKDESATR